MPGGFDSPPRKVQKHADEAPDAFVPANDNDKLHGLENVRPGALREGGLSPEKQRAKLSSLISELLGLGKKHKKPKKLKTPKRKAPVIEAPKAPEASPQRFESMREYLEGRGHKLSADSRKSLGERLWSGTKKAGEWYKKQPFWKKALVSGTLAGLSLATGGAGTWFWVLGAGYGMQRALGGAATTVALEGYLAEQNKKNEKWWNKGPARTLIAGTAGILVGSGALGSVLHGAITPAHAEAMGHLHQHLSQSVGHHAATTAPEHHAAAHHGHHPHHAAESVDAREKLETAALNKASLQHEDWVNAHPHTPIPQEFLHDAPPASAPHTVPGVTRLDDFVNHPDAGAPASVPEVPHPPSPAESIPGVTPLEDFLHEGGADAPGSSG